MHGVGGVLRQAMIYAKPWQRYVFAGTVIALGLSLVALGQAKGLVLVANGGFMTFEFIRHRIYSNWVDHKHLEAPHVDNELNHDESDNRKIIEGAVRGSWTLSQAPRHQDLEVGS